MESYSIPAECVPSLRCCCKYAFPTPPRLLRKARFPLPYPHPTHPPPTGRKPSSPPLTCPAAPPGAGWLPPWHSPVHSSWGGSTSAVPGLASAAHEDMDVCHAVVQLVQLWYAPAQAHGPGDGPRLWLLIIKPSASSSAVQTIASLATSLTLLLQDCDNRCMGPTLWVWLPKCS